MTSVLHQSTDRNGPLPSLILLVVVRNNFPLSMEEIEGTRGEANGVNLNYITNHHVEGCCTNGIASSAARGSCNVGSVVAAVVA